MSSRKNISIALALFLALNLVFATTTTACGSCPTPKPKPKPKPKPNPCPGAATCPRDTLKLGVCADVLGGLLGVTIGTPTATPCCTLINGLTDLEAAVCFCTAIKGNVLGIHLNIPLSLSVLLNVCSKKVPPGFKCA